MTMTLITVNVPIYSILASEDSSASCSEGGDSSCEAMEGPYGDEDGLVIHWDFPNEDL